MMRITATVRFINSDDSFDIEVTVEPGQSLVEAIQDTGDVQLEEWFLIDAKAGV